MSNDEMPEGLGNVTVIRPRIQSKADAKRVLRLCAEVPAAWAGYGTAEGFILEADYRRARAIYEGVLDPDPGTPKKHDWVVIEALVRELAKSETNRNVIRLRAADRYKERTGSYLSADSGTFKAKVREWLGPVGSNS